MGKIIFIGEETSIEFFKNFGFEIKAVVSTDQAKDVLDKENFNEIDVVFMTEEVFDKNVFSRFIDEKKLIVIPSLKSREGYGYKMVEELIRKATGMKEE